MIDIDQLETPSVLIDLPRLQRNIETMQARCDEIGLAFRPHIKTHKLPQIAEMQMAAGAVGIACQKLTEAQVFIDAGFDDIQIPYNIVGPQKTARLADMALYNRITVSADHEDVVKGLDEAARANSIAIRVMVELATEIERTGAQPGELVKIAQQIEQSDWLHFAGILVYPSYVSARPALQEAIEGLNQAGIGLDSVSGGGTGAALVAHEVPELTELRVGTYAFNDVNTLSRGWCVQDDCAMTVLATVVSRPDKNRAILDSGSKTLAADRVNDGHGLIVEYPQAKIYQLNEEHAYVDLSDCEARPSIGDRVHVIPVHACVVTNLHNRIYAVRDNSVEITWEIAARGLVW